MTYQVLARKWRPQDFASLVGQEHVVTALRNALADNRIAQAYLFSGIRGVGKTTAARLLAKALNCEQGPTPEPCNRCTPCREITAGSDLDVLEVDAATYSKVEQVRELTESLRYGAARDRYKVVVLDEIHRLSRQAFDALLKIVEEPPPHLVFVFATTESEAVPATILSRCQEFHFRRVASDVLARYLRGICEAEEITASDTALRLIARAGEGSVRDSVALLDQLATFGGGTIADEDAARLLGGLDAALLHDLLAALVGGDGAAVTAITANLEDHGRDPRHVFSQFLSYCRDALHLALGATGTGHGRVDLPEEEAAALGELARSAGYENLLRLVQQLLGAEAMVRRSENAYLAAEIAWLRAAELPKLVRVEELLGGGRSGDGSGGGGPRSLPVPRRTAGGVEATRQQRAENRAHGEGAVQEQAAEDEPEAARGPRGEPSRSAPGSGSATRAEAPPALRAGVAPATAGHDTGAEAGERAGARGAGDEARSAAAPSSAAVSATGSAPAAPSLRSQIGGEQLEEQPGGAPPAPSENQSAEPAPAGASALRGRAADTGDATGEATQTEPPRTGAADSGATGRGPARAASGEPASDEPEHVRAQADDPVLAGLDDLAPPAPATAASAPSEPAEPAPHGSRPSRQPGASSDPPGPGAASGTTSAAAAAGPAALATFLDEVRRAKQPLAAYLDHVELAFEDGALVILHDAGDEVLKSRLENPANREILDQAVRHTWGPAARWASRAGRLAAPGGDGEAASPDEDDSAADEAQAGPEILEHPTVQTVLELFGGTIATVEERDD